MKMTRILPTDKKGNIYYGPRTMQEIEAIDHAVDHLSKEDKKEIYSSLQRAGFTGLAARVKKRWDL